VGAIPPAVTVTPSFGTVVDLGGERDCLGVVVWAKPRN
jgi:hypothetical protein